MTDFYFGERWGALPWDAKQLPTPVETPCLDCREPIAEGDSGRWTVVTDHGDNPTSHPIHRECEPLSIVGHSFGVCGCTNYAGQPTRRAAALELWRRLGAAA